MKKISTFISLTLIIITVAISAVLFLNESYGLSAITSCLWIVSLTLWIGNAVGFVDYMLNKYITKNA
jgi:hypothetical protein